MSRAASFYSFSKASSTPLWSSNSTVLSTINDINLLATGYWPDSVQPKKILQVQTVTDIGKTLGYKQETDPTLKLGDIIYLLTRGDPEGLIELFIDDVYVVTQKTMEDVRPVRIAGQANIEKLNTSEEAKQKLEAKANVKINIKVTPVKSLKLFQEASTDFINSDGRILPRMTADGLGFYYVDGLNKETSGERDLLVVMDEKETSAIYRVAVGNRTGNNLIGSVARTFGQKYTGFGGKKSRKSKKPKSKKGGKKNKNMRKSSKRSKK